MSPRAPENRIREYLDRHGGTRKMSMRQLLARWDIDEPSGKDLDRVAEALSSAGIKVEPSLHEASPGTPVALSLSGGEPAGGRGGRKRARARSRGPRAKPKMPRIRMPSVPRPSRPERGGASAEAAREKERARKMKEAIAKEKATPPPPKQAPAPKPAVEPSPRREGSARKARARPRIRAPRVRKPRIGKPRIRKPRVRAPHVRAPGVRAPRISAERVRGRLPDLSFPDNGTVVAALAIGVVAVVLGLGKDNLYGFVLLLGALAVLVAIAGLRRARRQPQLGGDRLAIGAAALGVIALLLGAISGFSLEDHTKSSGPRLGPGGVEISDRESYCNSGAGDKLTAIMTAGQNDADALKKATDGILKVADDAPSGAFCAVTALDAIATSWEVSAGEPGYEDAADQASRVRSFQQDHELVEPLF